MCQHRRLVLLVGSLICFIACKIQLSDALFNCFTPNMFKMGGKMGAGQLAGVHPGERAHWYPQQYAGATNMAYGAQHPMSRLFQPKWRSSLFGPKRWMDWRMGGANGMNGMNFYRPGYGYWPPTSQIPSPSPALNPALSGGISSNNNNNYNQFSDQLNLSPYTSNPNAQQLPSGGSSGAGYGGSTSGGYGSTTAQQLATNNYNLNDGWSVPYNQQQQQFSRPAYQPQYGGDSYGVMPGPYSQPAKQQLDPNSYGTKGASGNKSQQQQQQQQQQQYGTTKNVLVADGGYNSMDRHQLNHQGYTMAKNYSLTGFGYSYPEWYSGVVESPAKIAQQLHKIQQRRAQLGLKY